MSRENAVWFYLEDSCLELYQAYYETDNEGEEWLIVINEDNDLMDGWETVADIAEHYDEFFASKEDYKSGNGCPIDGLEQFIREGN